MPHLSIVIPAYNEEKRLPRTLARTIPFLREKGFAFEFVIVDDGSKDTTLEVVRELSQTYPEIRLISDGINRGRGAAVKKGIAEARGDLILETDADGSVADEAIARFVAKFDADPALDVIFGSRELPESHIVLWQPFLRVFLGYGFLFLARAQFWMWSTTDFTLGFKMYRREAAHDVFKHQFDHFYVAEAEKVFVTKIRGHRFIELPVTWTDDPDSRVRPVRDTLRSLKGMACILLRFMQGKYQNK
ncbi:MAG: glycosyltransferase [Minisyncoccia bacterium]